jgi:hypothetical protein
MKDPIKTLLHEEGRFEPPIERANRSLVPDYETHYRRSLADLEGYWEKIAAEFTWSAPWTRVLDWQPDRVLKAQELGLDPGDVSTIEE